MYPDNYIPGVKRLGGCQHNLGVGAQFQYEGGLVDISGWLLCICVSTIWAVEVLRQGASELND